MEFGDILGTVITALIGAAIPTVVAIYAAFKAKAASDGVTDWKDYVVDTLDEIASGIVEDDEKEVVDPE